jgi:hypothetical protein
MQAIHDRHADAGPGVDETEAAQVPEEAPTPSDLDVDSPEDVERRVEEQMQARQAEAERARAAHRAGRRKPGAHERQARDDARQASQSLREVYRRLAAALHPDRETDPAQRQRKTALMQRANQAYAAHRLLDLLQLQLEAEQIDPARIAALGDQRLGHYTRLLAEQLAELRRQVQAARHDLCAALGLDPVRSKPATLAKQLARQVKALQLDHEHLRMQLRVLRADPEALRPWIRQLRAAQRQRGLDADAFADEA